MSVSNRIRNVEENLLIQSLIQFRSSRIFSIVSRIFQRNLWTIQSAFGPIQQTPKGHTNPNRSFISLRPAERNRIKLQPNRPRLRFLVILKSITSPIFICYPISIKTDVFAFEIFSIDYGNELWNHSTAGAVLNFSFANGDFLGATLIVLGIKYLVLNVERSAWILLRELRVFLILIYFVR